MSEFRIEAVRSPNLTDSEARRRLAAAYRIILEAGRRRQAKKGELQMTPKEDGSVSDD